MQFCAFKMTSVHVALAICITKIKHSLCKVCALGFKGFILGEPYMFSQKLVQAHSAHVEMAHVMRKKKRPAVVAWGKVKAGSASHYQKNEVDCESSVLRPIFNFFVLQRPLLAIVIITAAEEDFTWSSVKSDTGRRLVRIIRSNKNMTFTEETSVYVHCET